MHGLPQKNDKQIPQRLLDRVSIVLGGSNEEGFKNVDAGQSGDVSKISGRVCNVEQDIQQRGHDGETTNGLQKVAWLALSYPKDYGEYS